MKHIHDTELRHENKLKIMAHGIQIYIYIDRYKYIYTNILHNIKKRFIKKN